LDYRCELLFKKKQCRVYKVFLFEDMNMQGFLVQNLMI